MDGGRSLRHLPAVFVILCQSIKRQNEELFGPRSCSVWNVFLNHCFVSLYCAYWKFKVNIIIYSCACVYFCSGYSLTVFLFFKCGGPTNKSQWDCRITNRSILCCCGERKEIGLLKVESENYLIDRMATWRLPWLRSYDPWLRIQRSRVKIYSLKNKYSIFAARSIYFQ